MSFLSSLFELGKTAATWFTGASIGASIARTVVTGYALGKVVSSIAKKNSPSPTAASSRPDPGVRLQIKPDPNAKIPVVYGSAYLGGIITDAQISSDNKTMFYCLTICEKTGNINLGQGAPSTFEFRNIYWNDLRLVFKADGITVDYAEDRDGNQDTSLRDLVKVYCYAGNSSTPVVPTGYTNGTLSAAYSNMQGWTANHSMSELIFAIVQVTYDREKSVTQLGNIKFNIVNSMNQPGDCIYDYATNTRYGAGIAPTEIYSL